MYRLTCLVGIALLAWATSGRGQAADKPSPAKAPPAALFLMRGGSEAFIKRFDKNGDGTLTRDEVPPFLTKSFDKFDTNHDGKLDRGEIEALRRMLLRRFASDTKTPAKEKGTTPAKNGQGASGPDFDALDRNADGRLTRDELKGTPYASRFDEIDTNRDGQIDRREFEAFLQREAQKKKD